ncbi:DUF3626 domain-containing protein [Plantibacter cousiniae (nom. nud.)]|uniref:DUF3626 domain-containing protein n=1 Tax=Plantibacter cousiniae (nom. nud.) TaxID=199709 RepID=A0ABY1LGA8_9MICO|nr:DUF3626 domain-containing protein [Plantibacter cousiniae]SKC37444.1 Protein of unknown function [Plantibacter cousiniae]
MPARILLHFHPDWPSPGATVIDAMVSSGRYLSQFETGTSNGSLSAGRGGDRWSWESRLFNRRYDAAPAEARPVYGAVDLGDAYGAAPRFGSAFLRLRSEISERATYCYPDSVFEPEGVVRLEGVPTLVERMSAEEQEPLDRYVEAHVHGGVRFATDVEAIVLDPCYRDTVVHAAASHLSEVEFHPGFTVDTGALDPAYRGLEYVTLAASLAGTLTPDVLGDAARSGRYGPQSLKKVWHLLARYGRVVDPFEQGPPATKLPRTGRLPPAEVRRNAAGPP